MIPQTESTSNQPATTRDLSTPATTPEPIVLRDRYEWTCPACCKEHEAKPSLSMQHGHNSGNARCKGCNAFLHLTIAPDLAGDYMEAEKFSDYLDRIQAPQETPLEEQNG